MQTGSPRLFSRFSKAQLDVLRRLDTPGKVQDFLDYELAYNYRRETSCLSPLGVLRERRAHCIEGAMLAAAAFLFHGRSPLLLDLRASSEDDDHVIAPFREKSGWGAVAKSNYCGLRFREPVYSSPGELARSYFEFYYGRRGQKTLRQYSMPFDARKLPPEWLFAGDSSFVGVLLDGARHHQVFAPGHEKKLRKADSLLFEAEMKGGVNRPLTHSRPLPYSRLRSGRRAVKKV